MGRRPRRRPSKIAPWPPWSACCFLKPTRPVCTCAAGTPRTAGRCGNRAWTWRRPGSAGTPISSSSLRPPKSARCDWTTAVPCGAFPPLRAATPGNWPAAASLAWTDNAAWSHTFPRPSTSVAAPQLAGDGKVLLALVDGWQIERLDPVTGKSLWVTGDPRWSAGDVHEPWQPALYGDRFCFARGNHLYAY